MQCIKQIYNYEFENLNILECGAHTDGNETLSLVENNNCYYIEANPEDYKILKEKSYINKDNIFNFALSDYCGETTFTISTHPGNSSIDHSQDHLNELVYIYNARFHDIKIPCITYQHFIDNVICKPIDFLVLDVEGHETCILKSMLSITVDKLPKFICIEAGYNWLERKELLLKLGYNIDFYYYNNVFLTHSTFCVEKNIDLMKEINRKYPNFIWHGRVIFENDSIYQ